MRGILFIVSILAFVAGSYGQASIEKLYEDIDWNNRNKVFYVLWDQEGDKGYHISRTQRMFIIDNKIFIREFLNSDSRLYRIKQIEYKGDSLITAMVDHDVMAFAPYSELLAGRWELDWKEMHNPGASLRKVTLTKDKSTLIWSIHTEGFFDHSQWIDSYDILPSGYYYQNQRTTPFDPDKENFMPPTRPVFSGVYDLDEEPIQIIPGTEEYHTMERPYEGTWLEITRTDIGDVVYDYSDSYDGNSYEHIAIQVKDTIFTTKYPNTEGLTESSTFESILFYPDDGSYRFYPWAGMCYSFKWIDKEKHIGQWTLFYMDYNTGYVGIRSQKNYINEAYNDYPVISYDWK